MRWEYRLDRTPRGNVVQLRCGPLVVRVPQRIVQEMVDTLFPPASNGVPLSRWDVGQWEDLDDEAREHYTARHGREWR